MAGNTYGKLFTLTSFGESHGQGIGAIIDGCPSQLDFDMEALQLAMSRRRPGQSTVTTQRNENDKVEVQSGVFEGKTTGSPIGLWIVNMDAKHKDYDHLKEVFRPSHADFTYKKKYGHRDYRGGGRSSARETAARVAGGAVAAMVLRKFGIKAYSFVQQIGHIATKQEYKVLDLENGIYNNLVRCPDTMIAKQMLDLIEETKKKGDTLGGVILTVVKNCPVGLGSPVFDKLHADLAKAIMSINACKGFEIGSGFEGVNMLGSEHNDAFIPSNRPNFEQVTKTNYSGGVQGGISNGADIYFRAAFKPVSTIMTSQMSIDIDGNEVEVHGKGRHDPSVLPRAVPVVEAMTNIVLVDHLMQAMAYGMKIPQY